MSPKDAAPLSSTLRTMAGVSTTTVWFCSSHGHSHFDTEWSPARQATGKRSGLLTNGA